LFLSWSFQSAREARASTRKFPSWRDCESIHDLKQTFVFDATIFKLVILAWMPESSAMDGNYMSINNIVGY
jgi:hypothetical protein